MTNVLVLGAGGQIARWVIEMLADSKDVEMTLYLRHARKLHGKPPKNAKVIEGDVLDRKVLDAAVKGQNVVYANLTGDDIDKQAKSILASMKSEGVDPPQLTIDERYCRGDWDAPKSEASNATIPVNLSVIERIFHLKSLTVNVCGGGPGAKAVRRYRVVKKDGPDDLVFQSVRTGAPDA